MLNVAKILVAFTLIACFVVSTEADTNGQPKSDDSISSLEADALDLTALKISNLVKRQIVDLLPVKTPEFIEGIAVRLDSAIWNSVLFIRSLLQRVVRPILRILYKYLPEAIFWRVIPRGLLKLMRDVENDAAGIDPEAIPLTPEPTPINPEPTPFNPEPIPYEVKRRSPLTNSR